MVTYFFVHKVHMDWSHHKWQYPSFDVIDINKSIQGSSGNIINVQQVDDTKWAHALWPVKFCPKADANLVFLTCKLLQGNKISGVNQNNIVVKSSKGDIILDQQIKTCDGWVARVKFLCETGEERAQSATAPHKKNINDPHINFLSSIEVYHLCHC